MKEGYKRVLLAVLVAAALATAAFVLGNSLLPSSESWGESNVVANLLAPVLERFYHLVQVLASLFGHSISLTYGEFVRKLAHFFEYLLLGAEIAGITVALTGKAFSPYTWADLYLPLAVAVSDEFLQVFTGRSSKVMDVLIDYSGALLGIVLVLLIARYLLERPRT